MGLEAATKALLDAGITHDSVEGAFVGYVYGASTTGQAALYQLRFTGIPITNVNNNCSTGSIALVHAAALIRAGDARSPMGPLAAVAERASPDSKRGPPMPRMFGAAATKYFRKYGGGEHLAKIAAKNHKHSVNNPYTQFRAGYDEAAVLASPQISNELTKFMCSPTSDGAACCTLANEAFVHANRLKNQAIEFIATGLAADYLDAFAGRSDVWQTRFSLRQARAGMMSGLSSYTTVSLLTRANTFYAQLVTYPALGLCAVDDAHRFVERGDNTYGGKYVVNPSGGLEAKGHPLGATGLAMHFSITIQLRNWAGPMRAPGPFDLADARGKYGLVHNIGLGG
ncbi:thiolase-like protein, partial [Lactarius sanguifluus]